jgi:DNA modification methylase
VTKTTRQKGLDNVALKVEQWPIDRPKPYARNARKISDAAISKVAASLSEFGWRQPIVVDEAGVIIAGHTRLLAAKKLGMTEVPVHVAVGLTPEQVKAYRLMDNRSHEEAEWDLALLAPEIADLQALAVDLSLTGFDEDEITRFLADAGATEGLTDPDAVPDTPEVPVSVSGDLWLMGRHRLLCGDSTSIDAVERLMGGEKADMVFTDPPYGMDYEGGRGKANFGRIANDAEAGTELREMLHGALSCAVAAKKQGASAYICFTWRTYDDFLAAMNGCGLEPKACIVWDKQRIGLSHGDYRPQHEFIFYVGGGSWYGDRAQSDVWDVSRDTNRDYVHPTQKPVELIMRALGNSSKAGDAVLDLFGGSGSTIIACEKTGRNARLMELDPKYCDVIVNRWQDFTGQKATLDGDGRTFDEIASERFLIKLGAQAALKEEAELAAQ